MPILLRRYGRFAVLLSLGAYSVIMLGCSGSDLGATVSGTVLLDGEPVGPGVVTFAQESGDGQPAVGQLESSGSYVLTTNKELGLSPGTYRVAVQAFEPPEGLGRGERSYEPSEALVPEKYMSVTTSGLQFDVEPGHNSINIPLASE